jgi:hypothetical protein
MARSERPNTAQHQRFRREPDADCRPVSHARSSLMASLTRRSSSSSRNKVCRTRASTIASDTSHEAGRIESSADRAARRVRTWKPRHRWDRGTTAAIHPAPPCSVALPNRQAGSAGWARPDQESTHARHGTANRHPVVDRGRRFARGSARVKPSMSLDMAMSAGTSDSSASPRMDRLPTMTKSRWPLRSRACAKRANTSSSFTAPRG